MKKVKSLKLYNFITNIMQLLTFGYIEKEPANYEDLKNY